MEQLSPQWRLPPRRRPCMHWIMVTLLQFAAFAIICASGSAAPRRPQSVAASSAFVGAPLPSAFRCPGYGATRIGGVALSSNGDDGLPSDDEHMESSDPAQPNPSAKTRRQFFHQQIIATSTLLPATAQAATDLSSTMDNGYFSLRNNNNIPYAQRQELISQQRMKQQERADKRRKATTSFRTKKWTPFVNVKKWNSVETCLLEMLPVKNPVFRQLQDLITDLEVFPPTDSEGWKQTLLDALATLSFLDAKRSILEPVFNQDDATELYITKSSLGERNIEALRTCLEDMIVIASGDIALDVNARGRSTVNADQGKGKGKRRTAKKREESEMDDINMDEAGEIDVEAFIEAKRRALIVLSELGELLVPTFPYAVPSSGKFGYLPRLLGRCSVTLSFERPSVSQAAFGMNFGGVGGNKQFLGNVTIIADGYAAPITAGNFVDLSVRNFYTGLSVKAMRKRLGVVPTWSDNVIVNDLTELKDNLDELKDSAFELPETLKKAKEESDRGGGGISGMFRSNRDGGDIFTESIFDENRVTMDAVLPILGSFQEGFYDPLTAKPRRIPLEVVALDPSSPTKSTLTYSSSYASLDDDMSGAGNGAGTTKYSALMSSSSAQRSFSSATSSSSSNSTATASSDLDPVLSFNIPDVVALNHPDRLSNGGSSEFFALPRRDVATKRSKLLDGQYAPFGYIVAGSDVYQSLRPGDVIKATYVSDVGLLNLVKIRKNAFEGGEEDVIVEESSEEEG